MYTKCKSLIAASVLLGAFYGTAVMAQPNITVDNVTAQQGDTVSVPVSFENDGSVVGMNFDIQYDDTVFPSVDVTANCDGNDMGPGGVTCTNPSPGTITVVVATFPLAPIASTQIGTIDFTVDGAAPFAVHDLVLANVSMSDSDAGAVTPDQLNDGSIEVVDIPPEEISELSVTPAALNFGTVDLGNMPQTMTITAENVGGVDSSLTISGAPYSGDAEFSVSSDGCTGTTLNAGDTCDVDVEFNAGANGAFSGQVAFDSDADTNPTPTVEVAGEADSVANLSIDPAGAIGLGNGQAGTTLSSTGTVNNDGSADGSFSCSLAGDAAFSTEPSPLSGTVPAGGSTDFTVNCALPAGAEDGATFSGTLECTGDNGFTSTHDLSCGVTEFVAFPVPTMQKWGVAVLTLLMLMIGGLTVRYFRT